MCTHLGSKIVAFIWHGIHLAGGLIVSIPGIFVRHANGHVTRGSPFAAPELPQLLCSHFVSFTSLLIRLFDSERAFGASLATFIGLLVHEVFLDIAEAAIACFIVLSTALLCIFGASTALLE